MTCTRCKDSRKLLSGADCPDCTHVISWRIPPWSRARLQLMHVVTCSCGWRHSETSRQNALGRASKMRGAVNRHLKDVESRNAVQ